MIVFATISPGSGFLGVEWHFWKVVGWVGNVVFFSRFFVQWIATEKQKRVVVPISFWWLSLIGSVLLLTYGLWQRDSVFIFAYAFTWIPYIRSIVIHYRNRAQRVSCSACGQSAAARAHFCHQCGSKIPAVIEKATQAAKPRAPLPSRTLRPVGSV
jgi:lipid-A-disaccharide synthase-like uncharacterized protein